MATVFSKKVQPLNGNWQITIGIEEKDPNDVTLAQQFGDLDFDFSGQYIDPDDNSFSFNIPINTANYNDVLLNKLDNVVFSYLFDDATILSSTRYRQAVIMSESIETKITNALTALRALPSTPPVNTTFTV